jgi:hypothetical protein
MLKNLWGLMRNAAVWQILLPTLQIFFYKSGQAVLLAAREYAIEAFSKDGWTVEERKDYLKDQIAKHVEDGHYGWDEKIIDGFMRYALNWLKENPTEYLKKHPALLSAIRYLN